VQFAAEAVQLVGGNDDRGIRLDDRPVVGRIQALNSSTDMLARWAAVLSIGRGLSSVAK
jgi:hypothetical protein